MNHAAEEQIFAYAPLEEFRKARPFNQSEFRLYFFRNLEEHRANPNNLVRFMNRFLAMSQENMSFYFYQTVEDGLNEDNEWKKFSKNDIIGFFDPFVFAAKKKKNGRPINAFDVWMSHPDRLLICSFIFDPSKPEGLLEKTDRTSELAPIFLWNKWKGLDKSITSPIPIEYHDIAEKSLAIILFHFKEVINRGEEVLYQWFSQWFASIVQKPWQKMTVVPIVSGVQGAGKSFFFEELAKIFGRHGLGNLPASMMTHRFNGPLLEDTVFAVINETSFKNQNEANTLKNQITSHTRTTEKKFQDVKVRKDFVSMVWTSNDPLNCFPAERGSNRRYFPIEADPSRANREDYFQDLAKAFDNFGLQALYWHFKELPLDPKINLSLPPHTEEKTNAIAFRLDSFEQFWKKCLANRTHQQPLSGACFDPIHNYWVTKGASTDCLWDLFKRGNPSLKENWNEQRFLQELKAILPDLEENCQGPSITDAINNNKTFFEMPLWQKCNDYFYITKGLKNPENDFVALRKRKLGYDREDDKKKQRNIRQSFFHSK